MDRTLIIIPAFNEQKKIKGVVRDVRMYAEDADILIVNDGSTDATELILEKLNVRCITLPFNTGYGNALQTGFKYAFRKGYEYVIHMDGDGQHEAACLTDFAAMLNGGAADVVVGSRFLQNNEEYKYNISLLRLIIIYVMRLIIRFATGVRISDPTSGFIGVNRKALAFLVSEDYPFDYPDADVLIMMHNKGIRLREIPVIMYNYNGTGKIHSGIKPVYYVFKMFLSMFISLFSKQRRVRSIF